MDIKDFMSIQPEDLARKQKDELTEAVCGHLDLISTLIREGRYDQVTPLLQYSPSGDGYGSDNNYIDFSFTGAGEDISDMLSRLTELRAMAGMPAKQRCIYEEG